MDTVYNLLIAVSYIIITAEISAIIIYGWFISKKYIDKYMNLDETKLEIDERFKDILFIKERIGYDYVAKLPFSIFSKYFTKHYGRVPRWSKLHKRINEYYKLANKIYEE